MNLLLRIYLKYIVYNLIYSILIKKEIQILNIKFKFYFYIFYFIKYF